MPDDFNPALVERLADAAHIREHRERIVVFGPSVGPLRAFADLPETRQRQYRELTLAILAALPLSAAALNALEGGEAVVVLADEVAHKSSCARHNMPAYPNGRCDCAASPFQEKKDG